jgi:hypothetical protein
VRLASLSFALLAILVVLLQVVAWVHGAHIRIRPTQLGAVVIYSTLSLFLWRRARPAAVLGLIVAGIGLVGLAGAMYFMWPFFSPELQAAPRLGNMFTTMALAITLNLFITVVLFLVLLSNFRWSGP